MMYGRTLVANNGIVAEDLIIISVNIVNTVNDGQGLILKEQNIKISTLNN